MPKISSELILDEIEKRHVVPIPRWHFILKRSIFWLLAVISVITGSISMATAIYVFLDNDFIVDRANIERLFAQRPFIEEVVESIPYVWLIAMLLFIFAAYYGFRHTKKGYRYPTLRVIAGSMMVSLLICGVLNIFDVGRHIHRYLIENIQGYGQLVFTNEIRWAQMEKGYLGGKVVSVSIPEHIAVVKDYKNRLWSVDVGKAELRPGAQIAPGRYLKVTGVKTGPLTFQAISIRPWVRKVNKQPLPVNTVVPNNPFNPVLPALKKADPPAKPATQNP
ncbi:MAG: hypothetical protein HGB00_08755 [Chlorobiaceae bacterium]|nr:hypothetical protein [Chlorobiaceae bacterium]